MLPIILYAWFSADFILGMIHLYLDYVACPKDIGLKALIEHPNRSSDMYQKEKAQKMEYLNFIQRVAYDFKTHHLFPKALGRRTFLVLIFESLIVHVLPLLLFVNIMIIFNLLHPLILLYFLVLSLGFLFGQYAHANTHKEHIPICVKYLQKWRIFISVERHDRHHNTFKQSFCILNGWADFMINPLASFLLKKKWLNSHNLEVK